MDNLLEVIFGIESWPRSCQMIIRYALPVSIVALLYIMFPSYIPKELWIVIIILASIFQAAIYPEYWRIIENIKNKEFESLEKQNLVRQREYVDLIANLKGDVRMLYQNKDKNPNEPPTLNHIWEKVYEQVKD